MLSSLCTRGFWSGERLGSVNFDESRATAAGALSPVISLGSLSNLYSGSAACCPVRDLTPASSALIRFFAPFAAIAMSVGFDFGLASTAAYCWIVGSLGYAFK